MILVDTSVWVDHIRRSDSRLTELLTAGGVVAHPFVIGEIACGTFKNREEVLAMLQFLPSAPMATDSEVLAFIEARSLMGRGVGLIDVHLLASAVLGDCQLWTRDTRLTVLADEVGIAVRFAE